MDIKIKTALEKGYTCDLETGKVFGPRGKECNQVRQGYVKVYLNGLNKWMMAHRFVFYVANGYVPDLIDHIDRDKTNNSIYNLREGNKSVNAKNRDCKGYTFVKSRNKWKSQIGIGDRKNVFIGYFDTEQEAHQAYIDAKKTYHPEWQMIR